MTYDLWVVYDVRIGRLPDGTTTYSAMSIEIDLYGENWLVMSSYV